VLGAAIATSSVLWVSVLRESHAIGTMRPASAADRASTASPDSGRKFGDEARIVAAVKRVAPSVVALSVIVGGRLIIPANPFYRGGVNAEAEKTVPFQARSSGSGFVFTKAGLIVTTAHVVQPVQGAAVRIEVFFHNGDRVPAQLYAVDSVADIALIQVSQYATLPPPLEMGTSSSVRAGQWATAIGAPYELEQSVTLGVISGFNRTESVSAGSQTRTFKGLLQTSALGAQTNAARRLCERRPAPGSIDRQRRCRAAVCRARSESLGKNRAQEQQPAAAQSRREARRACHFVCGGRNGPQSRPLCSRRCQRTYNVDL
jgi:S1-C subfamily serine protease